MRRHVRLLSWLLTLLCFRIVRAVLETLIGVWAYISGGQDAGVNNRDYATAARVLRILARYRFDTYVCPNSIRDFLLIPEHVEHPELVLKPEVSLYHVTATDAIFVEARPGVEAWRNEHGCFHKAAQYHTAVRVIVLPLWAAHRLANDLGPPKAGIVLLANTSRCGSTLLAQAFESTGQCVILQEPWPITALLDFVDGEDSDDVKQHVTTVVNLTCKPAIGAANFPIAYVIKVLSISFRVVELLTRYYSGTTSLFLYRNVINTTQSIYKTTFQLPILTLLGTLMKIHPAVHVTLRKRAHFVEADDERIRHIPGHCYSRTSAHVSRLAKIYLRYLHSGVKIVGIRYEDLVRDSESCVQKIFSFCDIPRELNAAAAGAFQRDSQEKSLLSREALSRYAPLPDPTPKQLLDINDILRLNGLPEMVSGDWTLPGTIPIHQNV